MPMIRHPVQSSSYIPGLSTLFEKLNLGIIIVHKDPPGVVFSNRHFKIVTGEEEETVINFLFNELQVLKRLNMRSDIILGSGRVIGYTIYQISDLEFLVFLSDISYKRIYLENKGENRFYDRLSRLLAEVVHEIGNPLASVTTTLQVLQHYITQWDTGKKIEYLNRAVEELDRLGQYLGKMRHFSRVECSLDQSPVLLKPVILKLIDHNRELIDSKHIQIEIDVDDRLKVMVDDDFFYQVLLNLLINSIDAVDENGRISYRVEEVNEFFVKLVYRNNGPLIPMELQEKIFLPFYTTKKKGSGIGLAVSVKLMTRMGGTLKLAEPEKGWGVKFVLYLPVSDG